MRIAFFAARKVHLDYFQRLANALQQRGYNAEVIWHKSLQRLSGWITSRIPDESLIALDTIVEDCLREKANSAKHRQRSKPWWWCMRQIKQMESRWLFRIYASAIQENDWQVIVIWNGLKFRQRIAVAAARAQKCRPIFMENGLLPNMTTMDGHGVNYFNSVPRNMDSILGQTANYDEERFPPTTAPDDLPDQYLFVPFQVNTDSQVVLFSPWIRDMYALTHVFMLAEQHLGDRMPHIILKTHPACDTDYQDLVAQLQQASRRIQLRLEGNTQEMIAHASGVVTINSTVGIEAMIANKPLLVLGQAFYQFDGLNLAATNQDELETRLLELPEFKPNPTYRSALLGYLTHRYQVPGRWQQADSEHIKAAAGRIEALLSEQG